MFKEILSDLFSGNIVINDALQLAYNLGKEQSKEYKPSEYKIIRTYSAGVFYGIIEAQNGQEAVIRNARRIWYWDGASTLSQLAVDGTSKPENCKFPCAVDRIELKNVIEILDMTEKALKSLNGVSIWKQ